MDAVLDAEQVFERFVVGSGSQIAAAAARRAAESPGRSYNPLVIFGPSGLGKTHLLNAVGHRARQVDPELSVHYETAGSFVDRLSRSLSTGDLDSFREENLRIGFLLLDDLQEVAGKWRTQEELQGLWEDMVRWEVQVVIASDCAPQGMSGLSEPLRTCLAGGLTVEIGGLDAATRQAILTRWHAESAAPLSEEILAILAGLPVPDAAALRAGYQRLVRWAEQEGREPAPEEVASLAGIAPGPAAAARDEFGDFLMDVSTAVAAVVETDPWRRRIADAILRWQGEGIRTRRLEEALDVDSAPDVDSLLEAFERDVARLRRVQQELRGDARDRSVLVDPDRVAEAEGLLLAQRSAARGESASRGEPAVADRWFLDREKLAWDWVALEERLMEEQV